MVSKAKKLCFCAARCVTCVRRNNFASGHNNNNNNNNNRCAAERNNFQPEAFFGTKANFSSSLFLDEESSLIGRAKSVLNESSARREKITNSVTYFKEEYRSSTVSTRQAFLLHLANHFGVGKSDVGVDADATLRFLVQHESSGYEMSSVTQRQLTAHLEKLRKSLVPRYDRLFLGVGATEDGIKLIVDIRADLIDYISEISASVGDDVDLIRLRDLNRHLKGLLSSWFSVGLLKLETVNWQSSCDILQKVSDYERVHPVRSWTDMKSRVGPYRRCFIFTHSSMPRDPVVVLHTFLSDSISSDIQSILPRPAWTAPSANADSDAPSNVEDHPDENSLTINEEIPKIQAAVFYSINNTQKGLTGVDLGHYLIKNAVRQLQFEFPQLSVFSTLSPVPGFKDWLMKKVGEEVKFFASHVPPNPRGNKDKNQDASFPLERLFLPWELKALMGETMTVGANDDPMENLLFVQKLQVLISSNKWFQNKDLVKVLEAPLMRLCARYLYLEKHRGFALNPVANFHLRNGATLWRINWLGDSSPKGLASSFGLMANYRYFPEKTETNNSKYSEDKVIDVSDDVLKLVS